MADITRLHRDRQTRIKSCFDLAVALFCLASSRPYKMELSDGKFGNKLMNRKHQANPGEQKSRLGLKEMLTTALHPKSKTKL